VKLHTTKQRKSQGNRGKKAAKEENCGPPKVQSPHVGTLEKKKKGTVPGGGRRSLIGTVGGGGGKNKSQPGNEKSSAINWGSGVPLRNLRNQWKTLEGKKDKKGGGKKGTQGTWGEVQSSHKKNAAKKRENEKAVDKGGTVLGGGCKQKERGKERTHKKNSSNI